MKRRLENQLEDDSIIKKRRQARVKRNERENCCYTGGSASGDEDDTVEECVKKARLYNSEYRVYNYNFKKIDKNNIPSYIK